MFFERIKVKPLKMKNNSFFIKVFFLLSVQKGNKGKKLSFVSRKKRRIFDYIFYDFFIFPVCFLFLCKSYKKQNCPEKYFT
jgi:hypothetical protein